MHLQYDLDLILKNFESHGHIMLFINFMLDNIPKSTLYNQCFVRYRYLRIFAFNMSDNRDSISLGPYSETWYKKGIIRSQYKLIPGKTKPASYF